MTSLIVLSLAALLGFTAVGVADLPSPGREVTRAEATAAPALETTLETTLGGYTVTRSRYFLVDGGLPWAAVVKRAEAAVGRDAARVSGTPPLTAVWTLDGGAAIGVAMRPAPEGGDATVGYYQLTAR